MRGDRYLLCSDGLFNEVDEPTIGQILHDATDLTAAAQELVDLANEGGGRDNISVVIVEVTDDAGHADLLADRSDEHRVIEVVHGPRAGRRSRRRARGLGRGGRRRAGRRRRRPPPATAGGARRRRRRRAASRVVRRRVASAVAGRHRRRGRPRRRTAGASAASPAPRTRFTWRVALFLVALVARLRVRGLHGAVDRRQHLLRRPSTTAGRDLPGPAGRPALDPAQGRRARTGIELAEVPVEFRADIEKGKDQPSLDEARAYLQRITTEIDEAATTTTTTTTTGHHDRAGVGGRRARRPRRRRRPTTPTP